MQHLLNAGKEEERTFDLALVYRPRPKDPFSLSITRWLRQQKNRRVSEADRDFPSEVWEPPRFDPSVAIGSIDF